MVESRCGAVALGRTYLLPPLSSGGALVVQPWLRFHIPLIEPDVRISRIRLVWGFLCQAASTPFLSGFVIPFFCSTRAASILSSRPHVSIAVARRVGQGRRLYGAFFVKRHQRHFCRALSFHSFVRPAPRAFFRPDRTFPSPSRAASVKDGACMGLSLSSGINAIFVGLCHSILLFDPRREHSFVPTARFHRRRAPRRSRTALVWGFLCQAASTPFLSGFVIPFFCSTRAASILSSRPHVSIAVARRVGQGRRLYGAFFVKRHQRHFCRALSFHSFVRPAPRAFFRPDRTFPSPSRAASVKDGACMGLSLSSGINAIFVGLCHSILLFDPRREHSFVPTARFHRRRAPRRSRT